MHENIGQYYPFLLTYLVYNIQANGEDKGSPLACMLYTTKSTQEESEAIPLPYLTIPLHRPVHLSAPSRIASAPADRSGREQPRKRRQ